MAARLQADPKQALAQDPFQELLLQDEEGELRPLAEGLMQMSGLELRVGGFSTPIDNISGFEIFRKNTLQFTLADGRHLQTGRLLGFNALKYRDLYNIVKGKEV